MLCFIYHISEKSPSWKFCYETCTSVAGKACDNAEDDDIETTCEFHEKECKYNCDKWPARESCNLENCINSFEDCTFECSDSPYSNAETCRACKQMIFNGCKDEEVCKGLPCQIENCVTEYISAIGNGDYVNTCKPSDLLVTELHC